MLENVSIIIPFQSDNGQREKVFKWIKQFYASVMPKAEICLGLMNGEEINKSKAVNLAAKKATKDIFVIADADVVYDPNLILQAIKLIENGEAFVVPFTEVYNVEQKGTMSLLKKKPSWPLDIKSEEYSKSNWLYEGFAGKLIVISRKNFEAVGGFDERFIGWGGEDDAFSHSVQTICGKLVNIKGELFHLWHAASSYETNPHGQENGILLGRYERASGNKKKMIQIIKERIQSREKQQENLESNDEILPQSPRSKICFAILVHENKELVKQLIENVRYYCPNSTMVLYNGGDDPTLCDGLGIPVCPSSRKLERGWTTIYFLEVMEWLEDLGMDYDYFINIDSDALFIKKGYEEFIQTEMKDTDYMGVLLRIPEDDWYIGEELKKDINRWKKLFNVNPFYGVFNVGQVISRSVVKALLDSKRKQKLKKALLKTISFGTDEVFFVNMAKELGFRLKKYPNKDDNRIIRYRPYFTIEEMIYDLNKSESNGLCHPVIRDQSDPVRKLILSIEHDYNTKQYRSKEYPWYENQEEISVSLPITSEFGKLEMVVRSGSSLIHYYQDSNGKWRKSEKFAKGVTGNPVFFESSSGDFGVVCKLQDGRVGFWLRNNKVKGYPWYGPNVYQINIIEPVMASQLTNGNHIIVFKEANNKLAYMELDPNNWNHIFPNK